MKTEQTIAKIANTAAWLSLGVVLTIGTIVFVAFQKESPEVKVSDYYFCGTRSTFSLVSHESYCRIAEYIGQDFDFNNGAQLTKANCLSCHRLSNQKLIGPPLFKLEDRLPKNRGWLVAFLTNSDSLLNAGDSYVVALKQKPNLADWIHHRRGLSSQEVADIAGFIMTIE